MLCIEDGNGSNVRGQGKGRPASPSTPRSNLSQKLDLLKSSANLKSIFLAPRCRIRDRD